MRLRVCFSLAGLLLFAGLATGQFRGFQAATLAPAPPLKLTPGEVVELPLIVRIRRGYHINSNKPTEDYMIPTRLTWDSAEIQVEAVEFPEAELYTLSFSDQPLAVFSGEFVIKTRFRAPRNLPATLTEAKATLHSQACNDKACLAPTTAEITAPVVRN